MIRGIDGHDEEIAANVDNASIAYASDEMRLLFRHLILATSSSGTGLDSKDFPGAGHSDGGELDDKLDGFADQSLEMRFMSSKIIVVIIVCGILLHVRV